MTELEMQQYRALITPLAKFLANKHINDEVHTYVVADIYDIVNEIRDELVKKGMKIIWRLQASEDFYVNPQKRTQVLELQRVIRGLQGVTNDEKPVPGDMQAEQQA